ncbi:MFS transporter [Geodermatophilus sp. SYSU D01186]
MSVTTGAARPSIKIDGKRRWVFYAVLYTNFVVWLDTAKFSVLTPFWAADLGADATQIASISASYLLGYFPMLFLAGVLADRIGPRLMLLICLTGVTVLGGSMAFVTTVDEMYWRNMLFGVFFGFLWAPCQRMLAVWFAPIETAKVTAAWVASLMIVSVVAPLIALPIASTWGWEEAFLIISALGIPAIIAIAVFTRNRPDQLPGISAEELAHINVGRDEAARANVPLREIAKVFKSRSVLFMVVAGALATTPTWLIGTWSTYGLITLQGIDPDVVTYVAPLAAVPVILYAFGHGRAVAGPFRGRLRPPMVLGAALGAVGFLSAGLLDLPWLAWLFAIGMLGFMVDPLFWGSLNTYWLGVAKPELTGTLNGVAAGLQVAFGYVLVNASGGWLDTSEAGLGQLDTLWIVGGVVFLLSIIPVLLSKDVRIHAEPEPAPPPPLPGEATSALDLPVARERPLPDPTP